MWTHPRRIQMVVLGIALLIRILYLIDLPNDPSFFHPKVDAFYYDLGARTIAGGDIALGDRALRMSPGYFYFLGAIYAVFGHGPWPPRVLQFLLGLLQVVLVWDAARRLFGSRWAWLPASVAALYGPFLYFEGHLLAASLASFLQMLLLWLTLRAMLAGTLAFRVWLPVGLALGAAAVVRPNALPLVVPVGIACWLTARDAPRAERDPRERWAFALAAVVLGLALAIAPITLRNWLVTGEPIVLTAHGGLNLYVGNGPGASGTFRLPPEVPSIGDPLRQYEAYHYVAEQALGRSLDEREADAYWFDRTLRGLLDDPAWMAEIMTRKLYYYWNGREMENVYDYEFARMTGNVLALPLPQFVHVAPLALCGSLAMVFLGGPRERFVGLYVWAICGAVVLVFVTDRYRLPVVAPALLCATWALHRAAAWLQEARWIPLAGAAVALGLAVAIAIPVPVIKHYERKYQILGEAWLEADRPDLAQAALLRSLEYDERYVPTHLSLGKLSERVGANKRAVIHYEVAAGLGPAQGWGELAEEAREGLRRLAELGITPESVRAEQAHPARAPR